MENRPLTPTLSPEYRGEGAADPSRFDKFPAAKADPAKSKTHDRARLFNVIAAEFGADYARIVVRIVGDLFLSICK